MGGERNKWRRLAEGPEVLKIRLKKKWVGKRNKWRRLADGPEVLRIRLKKKWVGKRRKRRRLAEGLQIYVIRLKVECKGCVTAYNQNMNNHTYLTKLYYLLY